MGMNAKQYREQLYRLRNHPARDNLDFYDQRDSFLMVYASVIPFAVAEYIAELQFQFMPGGLVFPVGFLLFWAFYYTFYKPGFLEERLSSSAEWNLARVPALLLGVMIWFVKVSFVELGQLVVSQWVPVKKPQAKSKQAPRPAAASQSAPVKPPPLMSVDLLEALQILGLKPGCTWRDIHRNYRTLAKQFHPDLNPEITDFGHRFMKVDQAYHKLEKVRAKYFA